MLFHAFVIGICYLQSPVVGYADELPKTFSDLIREFLLMQECNLLKLLHMNAHESKHIDSVND